MSQLNGWEVLRAFVNSLETMSAPNQERGLEIENDDEALAELRFIINKDGESSVDIYWGDGGEEALGVLCHQAMSSKLNTNIAHALMAIQTEKPEEVEKIVSTIKSLKQAEKGKQSGEEEQEPQFNPEDDEEAPEIPPDQVFGTINIQKENQ